MAGNLNAELQSYEVRFKNALAIKLPAEEFAAIIADEVRRHRPGAREYAGKHLVGEPTQKHQHEISANDPLIIKVVHVKGADSDNGNGNGNKK